MALSYRPIQPKTEKVRKKSVIQKYREENPYCEICNTKHNILVPHIEVHHILGGLRRTDEKWNIISACPSCHDECDIHKHEDAWIHNLLCFSIKYQKKEISWERLWTIDQMGDNPPIRFDVEYGVEFMNYRKYFQYGN